MTTLYATYRVPGDGVTTQFEFNFSGGYMDKSHVKAYIEDVVTLARTPVEVTLAMFVGDFTLNLGVSAPVGKNMVIYRDTPKTGPLVDFVTGSRITEANLDKVAEQSVFIGAEISDATNADVLAAATAASQAVLDAHAISVAAAASASASATAADVSEANAASSATGAAASAASILGAVDASAASAASAAASAATATTQANTAIAQVATTTANATAAAASATAAAASQAGAATSATTATTQATAAGTSATAAAASAASASTSAATATTKASEASASAATATTKAAEASASASSSSASAAASATSATSATTSAGSAATSASNSSTSANAAAGSASSAAGSATAASAAATAAAASYDSFDDRYLGPKATAPALDNDGNTLIVGALYFDTSVPPAGEMRVWRTNLTWGAAYIPADGFLSTGDIGTTVQPYDLELTAWAALATTDKQNAMPTATQAEMEAGVEIELRAMTPLGVAQAIAAQAQAPLVSGSNIKTINGESVVGSGDLVIQGFTLAQAQATSLCF